MLSDIPIIHETEDFMIINKPYGVVVTPGPGHPFDQTVAGWLLEHVGDELYAVGKEDRWGIVHRLDKDTSGVMVVLKTADMYEHLVDQFRSRQINKEYKTLVWGEVNEKLKSKKVKKGNALTTIENRFVIDAPIDRHPKGISKFIVNRNGKPSRTEFVIDRVGEVSIGGESYAVSEITAHPLTGRTHQIRVHLKAFGHPVVGDMTYQTKKQNTLSSFIISRQFLHSCSIGFQDLSGNAVRFEAPLSEDLQRCLAMCDWDL